MVDYEARGVSPHKLDVHNALVGVDPGLFPGAFCKAIPDVLGASPEHCYILHADGAGTKSSLAYLHYRRHGDIRVFERLAQDSLAMNLDDLLCVGAVGPFALSNIIGRNARAIGGEVIAAVIRGYSDFAASLRPHGVEIVSCGGETADLGDLVRTITIDSTLATRMLRSDFIDCAKVQPGHDLVGLASFGRAGYESIPNSGIGSNGFTSARHDLLHSRFRTQFPESFAPEIAEVAYTGPADIDDALPGSEMTVGDALLSPTRTYAPIMLLVLERFRQSISAVFHNSGGGQTKCLNFGENIRYIKDNLFEPPAIFKFIQSSAGRSMREMLIVFNMGHRLELACDPSVSQEIIDIAARFGVEGRVVGRTERSTSGNSLHIAAGGETIDYT